MLHTTRATSRVGGKHNDCTYVEECEATVSRYKYVGGTRDQNQPISVALRAILILVYWQKEKVVRLQYAIEVSSDRGLK